MTSAAAWPLHRNVTVTPIPPLQSAPRLDALRKLARRKHISEDVVVAVFETERHRLTERAKVENFVDVLAEKRARGTLRRMEREAKRGA